MLLVDKYALLPDEVQLEGLKAVQARLLYGLRISPREHYVLCRIERAESDPGIAADVQFSTGAVEAGFICLRASGTVITDVHIVKMDISKALLREAGVETRCAIDVPEAVSRARTEGTTRSVAATREPAPLLDGTIYAIGMPVGNTPHAGIPIRPEQDIHNQYHPGCNAGYRKPTET